MISLLKKQLRDKTISAVDLYAKTLNDLENKSNLNAFIYVNRDGVQQANYSQKRLQNGNYKKKLKLIS